VTRSAHLEGNAQGRPLEAPAPGATVRGLTAIAVRI
jgi:hypothetical protein